MSPARIFLLALVLPACTVFAQEIFLRGDGSPPTNITSLDPGVTIRAKAATFEGLVSKTVPTFSWNHCDLMWVKYNAQGTLCFTMDRACVYEPKDEKPRWALMNLDGCNDLLDTFSTEFVRETAKLVSARPHHDGGDGSYAIELARRPDGSRVYEVLWESYPCMGNGLWVSDRHLFVLLDAGGKWSFLGEGPTDHSGKSGMRHYSTSNSYHAEWTDDPERPVQIRLHREEWSGPAGEGDLEQDYPDLTVQRDGILDPESHELARWTTREYVIAEKDDTLDRLALRLARWRTGYFDDKRHDDAIAAARELLLSLNPELAHKAIGRNQRIFAPDENSIGKVVESRKK
jgi:hypothetical protein